MFAHVTQYKIYSLTSPTLPVVFKEFIRTTSPSNLNGCWMMAFQNQSECNGPWMLFPKKICDLRSRNQSCEALAWLPVILSQSTKNVFQVSRLWLQMPSHGIVLYFNTNKLMLFSFISVQAFTENNSCLFQTICIFEWSGMLLYIFRDSFQTSPVWTGVIQMLSWGK